MMSRNGKEPTKAARPSPSPPKTSVGIGMEITRPAVHHPNHRKAKTAIQSNASPKNLGLEHFYLFIYSFTTIFHH
jgi:hypothetical protein